MSNQDKPEEAEKPLSAPVDSSIRRGLEECIPDHSGLLDEGETGE